jgi:uncharacterized membrane protein YdjX (TVP38/TMEM64 family)
MSEASRSLKHDWLPAILAGLWATALFAVGVVLAAMYAAPIQDAVTAHGAFGVLVFFVTSVVAVLIPLLSNLLLVPFAVLAWGPWSTAGLLWAGWIVGAGLSFALGRHARAFVLRHFPAVHRYGDIDRLIDPRHRFASLVLLRMTFPVDVLSYSLGLFSRSTTLAENVVSTAVGAAPFAVLFALVPTLSTAAQVAVIGGSVLAFVAYVPWVLRRSSRTTPVG